MIESEIAVPPPRRRRWLWLVLVVFAFLSAVFGIVFYRTPTQVAIAAVGGSLEYDSTNPRLAQFAHQVLRQPMDRNLYMGPRDLTRHPLFQVDNPQLRDEHLLQLDLDPLGKLYTVDISGPQVTDIGFAHVAKSPVKITILVCRNSRITDAGLASLSQSSNLSYLVIPGNSITDRGLESISALQRLSYLHLGDTLVTDSGLASSIPRLSGLNCLDIRNTEITDAGLGCLADSQNSMSLKVISLDTLQATDVGIQHLRGRSVPLDGIGLSGISARKQSRLGRSGMASSAGIDDALLARVSTLSTLRFVCLYGTVPNEVAVITPAAAKSLKAMPALTGLYLFGIRLPQQTLQEIDRQAPKVKVVNFAPQ